MSKFSHVSWSLVASSSWSRATDDAAAHWRTPGEWGTPEAVVSLRDKQQQQQQQAIKRHHPAEIVRSESSSTDLYTLKGRQIVQNQFFYSMLKTHLLKKNRSTFWEIRLFDSFWEFDEKIDKFKLLMTV